MPKECDTDSDVDLYGDLPNIACHDETVNELEDSKKKLENEVGELRGQVEELTKKNSELESKCNALAKNISSLYKTATAEIERKDRMIAELRKEKDNIVFRRNRKGIQKVNSHSPKKQEKTLQNFNSHYEHHTATELVEENRQTDNQYLKTPMEDYFSENPYLDSSYNYLVVEDQQLNSVDEQYYSPATKNNETFSPPSTIFSRRQKQRAALQSEKLSLSNEILLDNKVPENYTNKEGKNTDSTSVNDIEHHSTLKESSNDFVVSVQLQTYVSSDTPNTKESSSQVSLEHSGEQDELSVDEPNSDRNNSEHPLTRSKIQNEFRTPDKSSRTSIDKESISEKTHQRSQSKLVTASLHNSAHQTSTEISTTLGLEDISTLHADDISAALPSRPSWGSFKIPRKPHERSFSQIQERLIFHSGSRRVPRDHDHSRSHHKSKEHLSKHSERMESFRRPQEARERSVSRALKHLRARSRSCSVVRTVPSPKIDGISSRDRYSMSSCLYIGDSKRDKSQLSKLKKSQKYTSRNLILKRDEYHLKPRSSNKSKRDLKERKMSYRGDSEEKDIESRRNDSKVRERSGKRERVISIDIDKSRLSRIEPKVQRYSEYDSDLREINLRTMDSKRRDSRSHLDDRAIRTKVSKGRDSRSQSDEGERTIRTKNSKDRDSRSQSDEREKSVRTKVSKDRNSRSQSDERERTIRTKNSKDRDSRSQSDEREKAVRTKVSKDRDSRSQSDERERTIRTKNSKDRDSRCLSDEREKAARTKVSKDRDSRSQSDERERTIRTKDSKSRDSRSQSDEQERAIRAKLSKDRDSRSQSDERERAIGNKDMKFRDSRSHSGEKESGIRNKDSKYRNSRSHSGERDKIPCIKEIREKDKYHELAVSKKKSNGERYRDCSKEEHRNRDVDYDSKHKHRDSISNSEEKDFTKSTTHKDTGRNLAADVKEKHKNSEGEKVLSSQLKEEKLCSKYADSNEEEGTGHSRIGKDCVDKDNNKHKNVQARYDIIKQTDKISSLQEERDGVCDNNLPTEESKQIECENLKAKTVQSSVNTTSLDKNGGIAALHNSIKLSSNIEICSDSQSQMTTFFSDDSDLSDSGNDPSFSKFQQMLVVSEEGGPIKPRSEVNDLVNLNNSEQKLTTHHNTIDISLDTSERPLNWELKVIDIDKSTFVSRREVLNKQTNYIPKISVESVQKVICTSEPSDSVAKLSTKHSDSQLQVHVNDPVKEKDNCVNSPPNSARPSSVQSYFSESESSFPISKSPIPSEKEISSGINSSVLPAGQVKQNIHCVKSPHKHLLRSPSVLSCLLEPETSFPLSKSPVCSENERLPQTKIDFPHTDQQEAVILQKSLSSSEKDNSAEINKAISPTGQEKLSAHCDFKRRRRSKIAKLTISSDVDDAMKNVTITDLNTESNETKGLKRQHSKDEAGDYHPCPKKQALHDITTKQNCDFIITQIQHSPSNTTEYNHINSKSNQINISDILNEYITNSKELARNVQTSDSDQVNTHLKALDGSKNVSVVESDENNIYQCGNKNLPKEKLHQSESDRMENVEIIKTDLKEGKEESDREEGEICDDSDVQSENGKEGGKNGTNTKSCTSASSELNVGSKSITNSPNEKTDCVKRQVGSSAAYQLLKKKREKYIKMVSPSNLIKRERERFRMRNEREVKSSTRNPRFRTSLGFSNEGKRSHERDFHGKRKLDVLKPTSISEVNTENKGHVKVSERKGVHVMNSEKQTMKNEQSHASTSVNKNQVSQNENIFHSNHEHVDEKEHSIQQKEDFPTNKRPELEVKKPKQTQTIGKNVQHGKAVVAECVKAEETLLNKTKCSEFPLKRKTLEASQKKEEHKNKRTVQCSKIENNETNTVFGNSTLTTRLLCEPKNFSEDDVSEFVAKTNNDICEYKASSPIYQTKVSNKEILNSNKVIEKHIAKSGAKYKSSVGESEVLNFSLSPPIQANTSSKELANSEDIVESSITKCNPKASSSLTEIEKSQTVLNPVNSTPVSLKKTVSLEKISGSSDIQPGINNESENKLNRLSQITNKEIVNSENKIESKATKISTIDSCCANKDDISETGLCSINLTPVSNKGFKRSEAILSPVMVTPVSTRGDSSLDNSQTSTSSLFNKTPDSPFSDNCCISRHHIKRRSRSFNFKNSSVVTINISPPKLSSNLENSNIRSKSSTHADGSRTKGALKSVKSLSHYEETIEGVVKASVSNNDSDSRSEVRTAKQLSDKSTKLERAVSVGETNYESPRNPQESNCKTDINFRERFADVFSTYSQKSDDSSDEVFSNCSSDSEGPHNSDESWRPRRKKTARKSMNKSSQSGSKISKPDNVR